MSNVPEGLLLPSKATLIDRLTIPLPLGTAGASQCQACDSIKPTGNMRAHHCRHLQCLDCLLDWFKEEGESRCKVCLQTDRRVRGLCVYPFSALGDGFNRNDVNTALELEFDEARRAWLNLDIPQRHAVMRFELMGERLGERTRNDWYYDVIQGFPMAFKLLNGTLPGPVGPECQIVWKYMRGPLLGAVWILRKVVEGQYGIGWNAGESELFNGPLVGAIVKVVSGLDDQNRLDVAYLRNELFQGLNNELATHPAPRTSLGRMPRPLQDLGSLLLDFAAHLANQAHCEVAHVRMPPRRR